MSSSISPSKKGSFAVLALTLVASTVIGLYFSLGINPEISFWKNAFEVKKQWLADERKENGGITVFSGGSSTAFQIDCRLLKSEFDARSVNFGMHAGMGLNGTVAVASRFLQRGDRLVLMTEPTLLSDGGGKVTPLAIQMLMATGGTKGSFFESAATEPSGFEKLAACRPGLHQISIYAGKVLSNRPSYRYRIEEVRADGLVTTGARESVKDSVNRVQPYHLSPTAATFLTELKAWAGQRGIELVYALPVSFVPDNCISEQRSLNRIFLAEIEEIIPTWPDEYMGCWPVPTDFADTPLHMTEEAAKLRTRQIGTMRFLHQTP